MNLEQWKMALKEKRTRSLCFKRPFTKMLNNLLSPSFNEVILRVFGVSAANQRPEKFPLFVLSWFRD